MVSNSNNINKTNICYPLINAYGVQLKYANRVLCIKNLLVAD